MKRFWSMGSLGQRALLMMAMIGVMSTMALAADAPAKAVTASTVIFTIFDWVVILLLICASVGGIALAFDALMHIRDSKIAPAAAQEKMRGLINARQYKELLEYTATEQSFVAQALNAGLRRAHLGYAAMHEALESSVGEQTANLFRRIEMLNVIGNLGPLLGLMGTVLGMISAFYGIDRSHGEPKVADLAPGIAMALWHTFFGLFVAIPCLVAFGFFRTKLDRITTHAAVAAEDLLETLRPTPGAAANNMGGPGHVPASNVATAAAKQVETVSAT